MTPACRRCDWRPRDDDGPPSPQLLQHSTDAGHPLCGTCWTSLPKHRAVTCVPCMADARDLLEVVEDRYARLDAELGRPAQPTLGSVGGGRPEPDLPGGDVLVMLAAGAPMAYGGHLEGMPSDPPAVAFELGTWAEDWAALRIEDPPAATVADAGRWLSQRADWASEAHPAFVEFVDDLRRITGRLNAVLPDDDWPVRGGLCPFCEVHVRRRWLDRTRRDECRGHFDRCDWPYRHHGCADTGGLEDVWRCPRCERAFPVIDDGETWTDRHAEGPDLA